MAILLISFSSYFNVSTAVLTPLTTVVDLSPKYNPPVNSLTIIRSNPFSPVSFFKTQASDNSLYKYAGRKLAKSFNSFLNLSKPASGLNFASSLYQGDVLGSPPIEPIKTASALVASFMASSVSGTPHASMDAPPINISL